MYNDLFKEVNGYHKFLRCTNLQNNNFEFMRSTIALDKLDLVCAETIKAKPDENYSVFITYSEKLFSYFIW